LSDFCCPLAVPPDPPPPLPSYAISIE
jgi:hypothetical protein